jgi:hypothetical protein
VFFDVRARCRIRNSRSEAVYESLTTFIYN